MRVTAADRRYIVASIQHCHPISKQLHDVRLVGRRVCSFHCVRSETPAFDVFSDGVIKQCWTERANVGMNIASVVQDDDFHAVDLIDRVRNLVPVCQFVIRKFSPRLNREELLPSEATRLEYSAFGSYSSRI